MLQASAVEQERQAIASCRVDTVSVTFRAPTLDLFDDILDLGYQLNSYVDETRPLKCTGRGRHFSHVFTGGGLVSLEGTPPLCSDLTPNEARNAGVVSLTLNGQFFTACDAGERAGLLLQVASQPGFYHCTRLDGEITLVEPEVTAEDIVRDVESGRLWAARFQTQRAYGDRNRDNDFVKGCTQYWGGKGSDLLARSYDKAAESGWDQPAVRHELQLRGTRANDRFIQLKGALKRQQHRPPLLLTAESDFVKAMLSQDLDYRDTSKWAGRRKPKNWAQSAPTPGWWKAATDGATDSFEYSKRPKSDLDQTFEAWLDQYGRKWALKLVKDSINSGESVQEQVMDAFLKALGRTKEGDGALIHQELAGVELGAVQERLGQLQAAAARYAESGAVFREDMTGWPFEKDQTAPHG